MLILKGKTIFQKLTRDGVEGRPAREDDERGAAVAITRLLLLILDSRGGRGALGSAAVGEGRCGEGRGGSADVGSARGGKRGRH